MSYITPATPGRGRTNRQRAIRQATGGKATAHEVMRDMRTNILDMYEQALPEEMEQGRTWYADALRIATRIADHTRKAKDVPTLDVYQVVGIMAALSPSTDWDRNVQLAQDMAMTGDCAHAYGEAIVKARRIREGERPVDVLGGRKVRNFYSSIILALCPSGHVVVDRHAHAIALGVNQPLGDWAAKALDAPGRYQIVAAAYRAAARALDIPVSEVQATTWLTFRRLYAGRRTTIYQSEEF